MNHQILAEHKCKGKCPEFKTEQCKHCLINYSEIPNSSDFVVGDTVVLTGACRNFHSDDLFEIQRKFTNTLWVIKSKNHKILASNNEICHAPIQEIQADKRLNPSNSMESDLGDDAHIEKKQQVELLQTEIARLNRKCEMQATEMLSMQAEIDLLKAARETELRIEQEIDAVVCLVERARL